jgi:hypothetical protein
MEPEEKAKDLIEKMIMRDNGFDKKQQKHCAIVCVDEIIADFKGWRVKPYLSLDLAIEAVKYWEQVKQAIERL